MSNGRAASAEAGAARFLAVRDALGFHAARTEQKKAMSTTWKPHEKHGTLTTQSDLPDSVYAFPKERKEPMTDASHVRNAVARFDQVTGVTDDDREQAFANIKKAAAHYGVEVSEESWRELGKHPQKR
jgi:hypothetical protein